MRVVGWMGGGGCWVVWLSSVSSCRCQCVGSKGGGSCGRLLVCVCGTTSCKFYAKMCLMIHEQRDALFSAIGYKPTAAQLEILNDEARFKLVAGGVRAGKSNLGAMYMFEKIMSKIVEDPDAASGSVYWLVAADYERTRGEFDYLGDAFNRLGIIKRATRQVDPG